jgi:predicted MFS family arabinose efflux permease
MVGLFNIKQLSRQLGRSLMRWGVKKISIKRKEGIFIVFCFLFGFALFYRSCTAVIARDLMDDFVVTAGYLGLMASTFFYAYAIVQIPIGFLCDKIGIRTTVFYLGLLGVVSCFLFSFSTDIRIATLARALTGVGTAGIWIPALKYLAISYKPDEFATRTSIVSSIGGIGTLLATFPMAFLVGFIGWRLSLALPSIVMLLLLVILWVVMKPAVTGEGRKKPSSDKLNYTFIKQRTYWLFLLWGILVFGTNSSFYTLWGGLYLQDVYLISREIAGVHLFFRAVGMIVGGISLGYLSDRFFRARRPVLFLGTLGMVISFAIFTTLSHYPGHFCTGFLYFFQGFSGSIFLLNMSCVKEYFPLETAGTALGSLNAAMFFGVGLYQVISGFLLDYFMVESALAVYRAIFSLYIASTVLALLVILFLPETFPQETKKAFEIHSEL